MPSAADARSIRASACRRPRQCRSRRTRSAQRRMQILDVAEQLLLDRVRHAAATARGARRSSPRSATRPRRHQHDGLHGRGQHARRRLAGLAAVPCTRIRRQAAPAQAAVMGKADEKAFGHARVPAEPRDCTGSGETGSQARKQRARSLSVRPREGPLLRSRACPAEAWAGAATAAERVPLCKKRERAQGGRSSARTIPQRVKKRSRPLSRVLSWTVIPLGPASPQGSGNPERRGQRHTPLFGLAPGGVCRAVRRWPRRGALPHRSHHHACPHPPRQCRGTWAPTLAR